MSKVFVSHSSADDGFVRELQQALGDFGQDVWIDSREIRGGDLLWPEIQKAIEDASAFAIVVSPNAFQSEWVGRELQHALDVQKQRGNDVFPVVPLSLNGTRLGVLQHFFGSEPAYVKVSSEAGGIEAALDPILVALRKRDPSDPPLIRLPKTEPLEELVLELSDLRFDELDGVRRPSGLARLIHIPASTQQREVESEESWRFIAPLGPIEAEELRWYLEKYAIWPSEYFRERARKVEESLERWGQLLHRAALPVAYTSEVMKSWARNDSDTGRRFSIQVKAKLAAGASAEDTETARECATLLLGLPWELLHDGRTFLFQGAKPVRVRRRLPNTRPLDVAVVSTPIRILLVSARPEDDSCQYFDHRASALPLVEGMEALEDSYVCTCSILLRCRPCAWSSTARGVLASRTT